MKENVAIVALGTGQPEYEKLFKELAEKYSARVSVKIGYDNTLAHKIEAGADMFLMPSRYEPCGLNQIYSLRYGTVPVVRATGGLDDTIQNFVAEDAAGNGFQVRRVRRGGAARMHSGGAEGVPGPEGVARDTGERHGQGFFVESLGGRVCHAV